MLPPNYYSVLQCSRFGIFNTSCKSQNTSSNFSDITIITSNAGKIGIGFVSCFFDIVLLIQHYCLYGQNNSTVIARDSAATDQNQSDSAFEPIISSKRLNSITGDAFSPMESAVLYHAPKGDLMISTASFKDVFSRDVNASQVNTSD